LDRRFTSAGTRAMSNQALVHTYEREWGKVVAH
jgi:hypothetical protein